MKSKKTIPFPTAILTLLIFAGIAGYMIFGLRAEPHIPMILGTAITALVAMTYGSTWEDVDPDPSCSAAGMYFNKDSCNSQHFSWYSQRGGYSTNPRADPHCVFRYYFRHCLFTITKPVHSNAIHRFCLIWQPEKDSNPHKQSQSLSCYPYTIRLFGPALTGTNAIISKCS